MIVLGWMKMIESPWWNDRGCGSIPMGVGEGDVELLGVVHLTFRNEVVKTSALATQFV